MALAGRPGQVIEAIEAEGWYLDKMNGIDHNGNTTLFVLFRPARYQQQESQ